MTDLLRTIEDYELFLYTLTERFSSLRHSTITLVRRGSSLARVEGELHFEPGIRLVVRERLVFDRLPVVIAGYAYEAWQGGEKLYWCDPQPHPNEPALQSTFPHHNHVPPEMKHNRVPSPGMSFTRPNLPLLIREVEGLLDDRP